MNGWNFAFYFVAGSSTGNSASAIAPLAVQSVRLHFPTTYCVLPCMMDAQNVDRNIISTPSLAMFCNTPTVFICCS